MSFLFNDTATTEIYTLPLHGALPILLERRWLHPLLDLSLRALLRAYGDTRAPAGTAVTVRVAGEGSDAWSLLRGDDRDRKSTRLNFRHANISYAVFCLKKTTIQHDCL